MKIKFLLVCFLAIFINNSLYACDIVDKRNIQVAGKHGVEGHCSNNGLRIDCYIRNGTSGGMTCDGPSGTTSGYNLKDLINEACGCLLEEEDRRNFEEQMYEELR